MRSITAVTGPMRSGTSCLTGLLEQCGLDLGREVRVLRRPTEHNKMGHFETDLMFAINYRLLAETSARCSGRVHTLIETDENSILADAVFNPPPMDDLKLHAENRESYFALFMRKFDGSLLKDPLLCLTYHLWVKRWAELDRVIFCCRNPLSVAQSMSRRYGVSHETGLAVWKTYVSRFLESAKGQNVYYFDFDAFTEEPFEKISDVLGWLGTDFDPSEVKRLAETFYDPKALHQRAEYQPLPKDAQELYLRLTEFNSFGR